MSVWYRQLKNCKFGELGILEHYDGYSVMDVGNFAYTYNFNLKGCEQVYLHTWRCSPEDCGWIYIGEFES